MDQIGIDITIDKMFSREVDLNRGIKFRAILRKGRHRNKCLDRVDQRVDVDIRLIC